MNQKHVSELAEEMLSTLITFTDIMPRPETVRRVALQMFSEGYKAGYGEAYQEQTNIKPAGQEEICTDDVVLEDFIRFWEMYDKKINRSMCERVWRRLPVKERTAILRYIPLYKQAQPDKRYRKNPLTFLRNKSWLDELIPSSYAIGQLQQQQRTGEAQSLADALLNIDAH